MNAPLLDSAYRLLDESPLTLREIADGAGVGYHWLAKLKQRAIPNPGVVPVQQLHDWLATESQAA